jgi:hypothetical protein
LLEAIAATSPHAVLPPAAAFLVTTRQPSGITAVNAEKLDVNRIPAQAPGSQHPAMTEGLQSLIDELVASPHFRESGASERRNALLRQRCVQINGFYFTRIIPHVTTTVVIVR